jgi:biotin carboxyl carrier protein
VERLVSVAELRAGDRTVTAFRDADGAIRIGGVRYSVEPLADALYSVSDGESRWIIAVASAGEERWIFLDGCVERIAVDTASGSRRRASSSGQELSAPMPATVVRIHVEPGAPAARGDVLITLEAMKMELAIRAPRDGVVGAIHCKVGDLVQPGVNLLDLA